MPYFKITRKLFGGEVDFFINCPDIQTANRLGSIIYREALRLQKIFNFFDPSSKLSELNRAGSISATSELLEVAKKALDYCRLSEGGYDISHGQNFLARKKGQTIVPLSCDYRDIIIAGGNISFNNKAVCLDLGSIAKGYITDKLAALMARHKIEGLIDARGDIKIIGTKKYNVKIAHPRRPDNKIATISVGRSPAKAVATSGDYRQYADNYSQSHIVGQKDLISVTVVGDDLMEADAWATILMVNNKKQRLKLFTKVIQSKPYLKAMTINKNLDIEYLNNFEQLLR